jgi:hypothetical protein
LCPCREVAMMPLLLLGCHCCCCCCCCGDSRASTKLEHCRGGWGWSSTQDCNVGAQLRIASNNGRLQDRSAAPHVAGPQSSLL